MSSWVGRWSDFAIRWRWLVLGLTLLVTTLLAREWQRHLIVDTRWELMYSDEQLAVLEHVRENFDADDSFLMLVRGDVFSDAYLQRLQRLHAALERFDLPLPSRNASKNERRPHDVAHALPKDDFFAGFEGASAAPGVDESQGSIFEQIISLVNVRRTTFQDGALRVAGLMEGWKPGDDLAKLRSEALGSHRPSVELVDEQGKHSLLLLRTGFIDQKDSGTVQQALEKLAEEHRAEGFEISLAGGATFRPLLAQTLVESGRKFGALSLLMMIVVLFAIFRHPLGVLGPALVVAATVCWTAGTMALCRINLNAQTLVLPQLLVCIGVVDAIHVQSSYAAARARGMDNLSAIRQAISGNAVPVFLATATTAAGLASFLFSGIRPVWELGLFGSLGVMFALILTVIVLPPLLSFNTKSLFGARTSVRPPDLLDRSLAGLGRIAQGERGRKVVLAGMVVAAALAAFGLSKVQVGLFPLGWFPEQDPMRQAFGVIDRDLGGSNELRLLIEPRTGDMRDRELLLALERLEQDILAYREPGMDVALAGDSISVLDLVRESWRAFQGGDPSAYAVPPTQQAVVDMFTFLQSGAQNDLKHLITLNADSAIFNVRVRWVEAQRYLVFAEHIQKRADALLGERAKLTFTGPSYNIALVGIDLVSGLSKSFVIAFLLVGALIVLQCRSLRLGVIAMIPNAIALGCVLGAFGLLNIPLDAANVTFASIALGILDDDAIHFIHYVSDARREGQGLLAAIQSGYVHAGRAMVSASTVVGLGFSLRLAEYLRLSHDFGMLMTLSCTMGLAANLLFVPVLLRTFGLKRELPSRTEVPAVAE